MRLFTCGLGAWPGRCGGSSSAASSSRCGRFAAAVMWMLSCLGGVAISKICVCSIPRRELASGREPAQRRSRTGIQMLLRSCVRRRGLKRKRPPCRGGHLFCHYQRPGGGLCIPAQPERLHLLSQKWEGWGSCDLTSWDTSPPTNTRAVVGWKYRPRQQEISGDWTLSTARQCRTGRPRMYFEEAFLSAGMCCAVGNPGRAKYHQPKRQARLVGPSTVPSDLKQTNIVAPTCKGP